MLGRPFIYDGRRYEVCAVYNGLIIGKRYAIVNVKKIEDVVYVREEFEEDFSRFD